MTEDLEKKVQTAKEAAMNSLRKATQPMLQLLQSEMEAQGMNELLLFPFNEEGAEIYGWLDDDLDEDPEVLEFTNEDVQFGEPYFDEVTKEESIKIISRFGIIDGILSYHYTGMPYTDSEHCSMATFQLNREWDDTEWLPADQYPNPEQMIELIEKVLSPEGESLWRFTKEHPKSLYLSQGQSKD